MYSTTKKASPLKGKDFLLWYPQKGDTGHCHWLQYSVHQHQTEITMPFPVKLGQSARVRSSSTHQLLHEQVGLGLYDKRANEVVLGCFSASYPEAELSISTLLQEIREGREATLDQLAHFGRNWLSFWDQMASPAPSLQAEAKQRKQLWMLRSICHHGDGPQSCEVATVSAN